jgi:hypothetical protein
MKNSLRSGIGIVAMMIALKSVSFGQETFRVKKSTLLDFKNESKIA